MIDVELVGADKAHEIVLRALEIRDPDLAETRRAQAMKRAAHQAAKEEFGPIAQVTDAELEAGFTDPIEAERAQTYCGRPGATCSRARV
jgi:hypothetical protein